MVATTAITDSNVRFADERREGYVCVFAGATSGIGLATLERLSMMLRSSTFYILGRSPSRFQSKLNSLKDFAPSNKFIFVETQVSLISGIDAACAQIKSVEKKVDYICMSPGGMPFHGAVYTNEGLEACFAVSYYSRLRLVSNLLPLLRRSPQPRVLSILNGTKEKKINEDDIGLEQSWGLIALVNHSTLCTSLAFEHLVANDDQKKLVFIHDTPGFVNNGTERKNFPSKKNGLFWWAFMSLMQIVSGWIIRYLGMALKESGERHAFLLTSNTYTPGLWLINRHTDVVPESKVFEEYQERGWSEKIWDHSVGVWDKALASQITS